MSDRPLDEAFAQHLLKIGLVTDAQLKVALQAQAERALKGEPLDFGSILVQQGILTHAMRESLEKKLQSQREEAKRLGPYRILRKLGEGGMGAVYLAEDSATGQKIALKVLPKVAAKNEDAVGRFLREVDSARKLDHHNIVRAGAGGEDKGFHYFVMEYVDGETLGGRLKREEALPPDVATKVVLQVAHGLKYAHAQGFIHRDIKPDNVILSKDGVAKILDMGLSKNIDEAQTFRTVTGVALGTPHYIAPEQARGEKSIDGRADIYSLGATYYHLVTGETPFHGTTAIEIIAQHLNKQVPDPRDIRDGIPDGVVHVIRRMMAKKPKDRYKHCGELLTDLELIVGGHNPSSQALEAARSAVALPMTREARERFRAQRSGKRPGTYRATTKSRQSAAPLVIGGVVAAVILVVVLAVAMSGSGSRPVEPPPVSVKRPNPGVSKIPASAEPTSTKRDPELQPGVPAPRLKTREELRDEEAQRKLGEIEEAKKSGKFTPDEVDRRYGEFAKEFADTAQGKTIASWLKSREPKPPEEAQIGEVPKPEIQQPGVSKLPDPTPPQPVAKPSESTSAKEDAPRPKPKSTLQPVVLAAAQAIPSGGVWFRDGDRLVNWVNPDAEARWSFQTFSAGAYRLDLTYSAGGNGGGDVLIEVGNQKLAGKVEVTGDWAKFRTFNLGTVFLPAGGHQITIRAVKIDRGALMDLKTLLLAPVEILSRTAVPDRAKQEEATAAVKKAFPFDQAKTPKDKLGLARTLLTAAAASGAKDVKLYVLFRQARDLAVQGGDLKSALEAIDTMAILFDVDAMAEKIDLFAKTTAKGADAAAWAGAALDVAEEASEVDDYETAVKLAARAETLARAANDRGLQETAKARSSELVDLKRVADGLKGHFKTLETKPDDPVANSAVGKFVCLVKGDWKRGLPMLAKGSETAFKNLAEQELGNPPDAAARAALGEAWAAQAEKETLTYKARARGRAAEWLGWAIRGLTGMAKASAEKKLASLGPAAVIKAQLILDLGGGVRMEFLHVKPGVFTMGGPDAPSLDGDPRPPHRVEITKGFYVGKFEVTQAQWVALMGSNPSGRRREPDVAVNGVSWEDCQNFLARLNEKAKEQLKGLVATLPTEAQWEYTCRAGTKTTWFFGDLEAVIGDYAWYGANSNDQMHPVGQKKPNAWGFYDMHGNVWEWCQEWYAPYTGDTRDPEGPSSGDRRLLRGGAWNDGPPNCRVTTRFVRPPGTRFDNCGFRAVLR